MTASAAEDNRAAFHSPAQKEETAVAAAVILYFLAVESQHSIGPAPQTAPPATRPLPCNPEEGC